MNPQHLAYLAEIIDQGSLAKAAIRLNLTQPTLSRIVKQLEQQTNAPLFKRGRYGMQATVLCERLAKQGKAIRQNARLAQDAVSQWKMGLDGELRLGVGPMLAVSVMGEFFKRMLDEDWPFALSVEAGYASLLIEGLKKDLIDAAIIPSKLNLNQDDLVQTTLIKDELAIFCSANHPLLASGRRLSKADFHAAQWVETGSVSGLFDSSPGALTGIGIEFETPRLKFSGDLLMAAHVVAQTQMLCTLPRLLVSKFNFPTGLVELPIDFKMPARDIAFWTTKEKADKPEISFLFQRLIDYLTSLEIDGPAV